MFTFVRYLDAHQDRKKRVSTQITEGEEPIYKLGLTCASPQLLVASTGNTYWLHKSGPKWFMACLTQATALWQKTKNNLHGRDHFVVSSLKHQAALATTENKPIWSPNKQDGTKLSQKDKDFICHHWTQMHRFARPCSRHEHVTRPLQAVQAKHILRTKFILLL